MTSAAAPLLFAAERITEYPLPVGPRGRVIRPMGITVGPDGALWFTDPDGRSIGRITTSGMIHQIPDQLRQHRDRRRSGRLRASSAVQAGTP